MTEQPDLQTILSKLSRQISEIDKIRLDDFIRRNTGLIPSNCRLSMRSGELILETGESSIAEKLWRDQQNLLSHATITRFTILCGAERYSASLETINRRNARSMNKSLTQIERGCTYQELLTKVANTQYPAFVVEMPRNWHWGQPQRCLLTSAQVTGFSGRKAPNWHGDDVTLLYDRQEFERLHNRLMHEFDQTPRDRTALVSDIEYRSYTVASDRESLAKGQEAEYRSDIEVLYIPDLETIVRVCYCKERRVL
jgi:hypothetical protein